MRKSISELLADKRTERHESGASMQELMQKGIAASEAGDKQTANTIFRQVAEQYPDNLEVWVWLGWTSASMEESEAAFRRASELDPTNEEAALGLRWVAAQSAAEAEVAPEPQAPEPVQEVQQPEQPVAPQFDLTPSAPVDTEYEFPQRPTPARSVSDMLQQAVKTVQSGDKAMAYRMFEHLASVRAADPDIWVWLGGTSSSLDDAESAFRRARELDPFNEKATLGLRWVSLRRQVAYAAAMPTVPTAPSLVAGPEQATEAAPRKENFFTRFFKRFTRS
jgi:tetratricopeptide (TPR) repeat protein